MSALQSHSSRELNLLNFIKKGFSPHFDQLKTNFNGEPKWQKLQELGTKLWLDSGNIDEIEQVWTREFSALTVNNTLLNKEIQAGRYDSLIPEILKILDIHPDLTKQQKILEMSFALNAYHGLRLVEKFDAYVSLEEHTDLANDIDQAVDYAKRLYKICPERFYIKIPFTSAGLLATRRLSAEMIPVNHTLGFSARQNYVIARLANPLFLNVFLGRLNSFVAENQLGSGTYIGEKATLASQKALKELRRKKLTKSQQIGASFRNGQQIYDLAGIDVMTIPPKIAKESLKIGLNEIVEKTNCEYAEGINEKVDPESIRLDTLWNIEDDLVECVDKLEKENLDSFTSEDLSNFLKEHGCGDILVPWNDPQIETSYREGKIPNIENWKDLLESKQIGLDSLMNLAGLNSFKKDQKEMDEKVIQLMKESQK